MTTKSMHSSTLDFVITWVEGKYWFRGIEKNAPWVHNIYFVTWGHLPAWLNTAHPKLHIIKHTDFIPPQYLPTYNSPTIELNLHRIPGLSENFVYFNDDGFLIRPVTPQHFFKSGKCRESRRAPERGLGARMIKGLLLYHYHLITFFPIFVPEKEEKRDIYESRLPFRSLNLHRRNYRNDRKPGNRRTGKFQFRPPAQACPRIETLQLPYLVLSVRPAHRLL